MRLYDLQVGQRFTFTDKHRGKVFEVTAKTGPTATIQGIHYKDVATGEVRDAWSNRKTFRMEVIPVTENRLVELTPEDIEILKSALVEAYLRACEMGNQSTDGEKINTLLLKLTGLPVRQEIKPEGE